MAKDIRRDLFGELSMPATLADTKEKWKDCTTCRRLCKDRLHVVFGSGKETAGVMVVGQWPGKDEDRTGVPFQGKLGMLCREYLIRYAKVSPEDTYWANVLGCRIPDGDSYRIQYGENCHDLLESQINLVKPILIIAMGRVAIARLTGQKNPVVDKERGTMWRYKDRLCTAILHPAILNRITNPKAKEQQQEEISKELQNAGRLYREERSKILG